MPEITKLRNIDDTLKEYLKKFNKLTIPYSATEISEKVKINKSSFGEKYYPRARFLGLIYKLEKNKENFRIIKEIYGKDKWGLMVRAYYLLTPKSAEWISVLRKIITKYGFLIKKRDLNLEIKNLLPQLQRLEILSKTNKKRMSMKEMRVFFKKKAKENPLVKKYVLPVIDLKHSRGRKPGNKLRLYPNKEGNALLFSEFILKEICDFPFDKEAFKIRKKAGKKLERIYTILSNNLEFRNILDFELSKQKKVKASYLTFS